MFTAILVLSASFLIAYLTIPGIIHLAVKRNLYSNTKPVLQGLKKRPISNLGGIAIFVALRITQSLFIEIPDFPTNYLTASLFILFLVGLNDDLIGVRPISRLVAQLMVALIIVFPGELYFNTLDGMFGFVDIPVLSAQLLTILFIVALVNAYNLIDGIDGLAGSLGALGAFTFAYLFYRSGDQGLALLCLALFGALLAFLRYNMSPAKIFMGDSGAYIIGFMFALLSVKLVNEVHVAHLQFNSITISSAYGIIAAITIIPLFDTARVFFLRLYRKAHPFKGDNNHIHHRLLRMGLTHTQTTLTLTTFTLVLIATALSLQNLAPFYQLLTLFTITLVVNVITYWTYVKNPNSQLTTHD
jgi:UDP-GlcNAc:undecaprenyl-phosphate GlcNAc-1-phosphate transferase